MCVTHMSKITANNSHRFDDIADTLSDACRLAFIEKTLYYQNRQDNVSITDKLNQQMNNRINLMQKTSLSPIRR